MTLTPVQNNLDAAIVWIILLLSTMMYTIIPLGGQDEINIALYDIAVPAILLWVVIRHESSVPWVHLLIFCAIPVLLIFSHSVLTVMWSGEIDMQRLIKEVFRTISFPVYVCFLIVVFSKGIYRHPSKETLVVLLIVIVLGSIGLHQIQLKTGWNSPQAIHAAIVVGVFWLLLRALQPNHEVTWFLAYGTAGSCIYFIFERWELTGFKFALSILVISIVGVILRIRERAWHNYSLWFAISIIFTMLWIGALAWLYEARDPLDLDWYRVPLIMLLFFLIGVYLLTHERTKSAFLKALLLLIVVSSLLVLPKLDLIQVKLSRLADDSSFTSRLLIWEVATNIGASTFPRGLGLGQVGVLLPEAIAYKGWDQTYIHNVPLALFAEMGILGIFLLMVLTGSFLWAGLHQPWWLQVSFLAFSGTCLLLHDGLTMRILQVIFALMVSEKLNSHITANVELQAARL